MSEISVNSLKKNELYWLAGLFIFSLIIGYLYQLSAVMVEPAIRADASKYLLTAYNLVNSGNYSYSLEEPFLSSSLLVPGYPYFLAVIQLITGDIDKTVAVAFKVQLILASLVPVLLVLIARRVMAFAYALACGILLCVYPHQVVISNYLLTETLFSFLMVLAVYLLIRSLETRRLSYVVMYGLLFAYATLTRPITLLLLPFLAVIFFRHQRSLSKQYILAAIFPFLLWAPWSLWTSNAADLNESNIRQVVLYGSYPDFTYGQIRGFPNLEDANFTPSLGSWDSVFASIKSRVSDAPIEHIGWYLVGKPLSLWNFNVVQGQRGPFIYPIERSIYDLPGLFAASYWLIELVHPLLSIIAILSALAMTVMMLLAKAKTLPTPMAVVAGLIAYVTLFHIPFASLPRFSFPFLGFMVIMVVYVLYYWVQKFRESRS
jgi:hypothetical protein